MLLLQAFNINIVNFQFGTSNKLDQLSDLLKLLNWMKLKTYLKSPKLQFQTNYGSKKIMVRKNMDSTKILVIKDYGEKVVG